MNLNSNTTPTFRKDIARSPDGRPDYYYQVVAAKAKQLRLDFLENGFDSLQIRIWYEWELLYERKLIVIKGTAGHWNASQYDYEQFSYNSDHIQVKDSILRPLKLSSNWNEFINKLVDLKMFTLPTMDSIPGLDDSWLDGVTYIFEIATKSEYRFYRYHVPEEFADKFWQAKNVVAILSVIKEQLR